MPAAPRYTLEATSYARVTIGVLAGYMLGFHLGKIGGTLPDLANELGVTLFQQGLIIAIFSLIAGCFGIFLGFWASRFGALRVAIFGMTLVGCAALIGSSAQSSTLLLITRGMEGLGHVLATITLPVLIAGQCSARDRPLAMGFWGSFLPGGMAIMLLLTPQILQISSWRGVWIFSAIATLIFAAALYPALRNTNAQSSPKLHLADLKILLKPQIACLSICFMMFAGHFISIVSFAPSMLLATSALGVVMATTMAALMAGLNAPGNIIGGWLVRIKFPVYRLLQIAFLLMAGTSIIIFNGDMPMGLRIAAMAVWGLASGIIPGVLWTMMPVISDHPGQSPLISGCYLQGSSIGMLCGPVITSLLVEGFGNWYSAIIFTIGTSLLGIVICQILKRHSPA